MNKKKYLPLIFAVLGFGIFMFSRASHFIPHWSMAIIIAPIFVLAFSRSLPRKRAIPFVLLGFVVSFNIALWGLFDMGGGIATIIFSVVRSTIIALIYAAPYVIDRVVHDKLKLPSVVSTLTFPIAATAVLFLVSLEGPFDGDVISAVYAYGNTGILQIASIAGLFGFVLVFSWVASVISYVWEKSFSWKQTRSVVLAFLVAITALIIFGEVKSSSRLVREPETVKIAAVFILPDEGGDFDQDGLFSREPSQYKDTLLRIEILTEEAAINGAKVVAFQETAIKVESITEQTLLEDIADIAVENNVYVSLGYGVVPTDGKGRNMAVLVSSQGVVEIKYQKRYLLGLGDFFGETILYSKGPEVLQSVETPFGRIAISICRDLSFPAYARQAGRQKVDIMLNPSYDVPKSGGTMYSLRAIENGFSMVRPVYNGYSYAVDFNGRVLASMDSHETSTGIMYSEVPTRGVKTIYTTIGELLGWLCVIILISFVPLAVIQNRKGVTT